MKRTERIGAIIKILTDTPEKIYSLAYFCEMFDAAKSSISEDIKSAGEAIAFTGTGYLETVAGAKGGVKFVPDITDEKVAALQEEFCERLSDPSRLLGGNFIYTSDLFYDPELIQRIASVFARKFRNSGADYVATVETKGIPLAARVSHLLNLPLVVIRREAKISEGSTVSINYFSGSYDRIQRMSMSKRAITSGSKVLVIDDFMRGGGSVVGISEMVQEFGSTVCGVGVAIASVVPEKKKVDDYTCLVYIDDIIKEDKSIRLIPNKNLF
jgi:purine operon repressor